MIQTVIGTLTPEAALEIGECLVRQALAALAGQQDEEEV